MSLNVTKASNISAQIERVCDVVEIENERIQDKNRKIILCTNSNSDSEQENDNLSSSIFAKGFTPPPNFGRNSKLNGRSESLFAGKKARERRAPDRLINSKEFENSNMPIDWEIFKDRNSRLASDAGKILIKNQTMANTKGLINAFVKGNDNPGIHRDGERVFYKLETKDGMTHMKIIGIADKSKEKQIMRTIERKYDL